MVCWCQSPSLLSRLRLALLQWWRALWQTALRCELQHVFAFRRAMKLTAMMKITMKMVVWLRGIRLLLPRSVPQAI